LDLLQSGLRAGMPGLGSLQLKSHLLRAQPLLGGVGSREGRTSNLGGSIAGCPAVCVKQQRAKMVAGSHGLSVIGPCLPQRFVGFPQLVRPGVEVLSSLEAVGTARLSHIGRSPRL